MALLPNTGTESIEAGTSNVGGIIAANFTRLDQLLNPALSSGDPNYLQIIAALCRTAVGDLPVADAFTFEYDPVFGRPITRKGFDIVTYSPAKFFLFTSARIQRITLAGALTTSFLFHAPGREMTLFFIGGAANYAITWPAGITWLGGPALASLAAGKRVCLRIMSTTTLDTGIYISYTST